MIVDMFCGLGGVSLGIRDAIGRDPDVAINHDPIALAVHRANHPDTRHLVGDVWHYAPRDVTRGKRVSLLHLSPTCTFFSQAKSGPLDREKASKVRALATVGVRWALEARPDLITVENVPQFEHWGPLDQNGRPIKEKRGRSFRSWVRKLEAAGYRVEWSTLRACDYGAPTSRKRLFVIARRDRGQIQWPTATHGKGKNPHRSAAECIDWTIPVPSIFDRSKPLTEATCRRIARGIVRFVLESADPFGEPLRTVTASSRSPFHLVGASLIHMSNGERPGQAPRIYDLRSPLSTVVAQGIKHGLCTAHLIKHYGGNEGPGQSVRDPLGTVTTKDHHGLVVCSSVGDRRAEARAFMRRYAPGFNGPVIVRIGDEVYEVADIGMRQLVPRELARSHDMGDVVLEHDADGNPITKTKQVALIGNSVPWRVISALLGANYDDRPRSIAA